MSPLISVVIPSYKSRGGLKKSIDSALSQTYKNLEIIVIDDNNPDTKERANTERIMSEYEFNKKVIYIKHKKNKNGAAARNTGIKSSKGTYIAFLDDDDAWLPNKIEKQLAFLDEHPMYDAVYTYTKYDNGYTPWTIPYEGNVIIPLLMNRSRMYTSTILMKKTALLQFGGFDESFRRHQDYELMVKFFASGYKIGCIKEALTIYMPLGGNSPKGKDFEELKDKFLLTFSNVIDELDKEKRGAKKKIIVSNYATVFYFYLSHRQIKLAGSLLFKYFFMSPIDFISQLCFFTRGKVKKIIDRIS